VKLFPGRHLAGTLAVDGSLLLSVITAPASGDGVLITIVRTTRSRRRPSSGLCRRSRAPTPAEVAGDEECEPPRTDRLSGL